MNDDSTFQIWCYICDVGYQLGVLFLDFDLGLWLFSEDHSTQGIEDDADSIMETFILDSKVILQRFMTPNYFIIIIVLKRVK